MASRRGRKWAWEFWDASLKKAWLGNYVIASALAALLFFVLLGFAIVLKAVSPTPAEIDEFPMLVAKRAAAKHVFRELYMADCEQAALARIKEPFKTLAKKTGFYSTEAFAPALKCLDEHLAANGFSSLDVQLRSNKSTAALLDLNCVGDLRQTELCNRAFSYAQEKGGQIGSVVAGKLMERNSRGFAPPLSIEP
jgi:hypothetical protein